MVEPNYLPTIEKMREKIRNRSRLITLEDIASECHVSVSWIKKALNGEIEHPSVIRMHNIYNYVVSIETSR